MQMSLNVSSLTSDGSVPLAVKYALTCLRTDPKTFP